MTGILGIEWRMTYSAVQNEISVGHFSYCFDRARRYKFLLITNLTHFFMYLFISSL